MPGIDLLHGQRIHGWHRSVSEGHPAEEPHAKRVSHFSTRLQRYARGDASHLFTEPPRVGGNEIAPRNDPDDAAGIFAADDRKTADVLADHVIGGVA